MHVTSDSRLIVWGIIAVAVLVNVAGYAFNWYQQFWWYDKVLQAYTAFAATLPLALLLYGAVLTGMRDHRFVLVLTIANLRVALGALWKILELGVAELGASDIETRMDTVTDLIVDAVGAVIAGVVSVRMLEHSAFLFRTPKTMTFQERAVTNRR